jgi:hypothetical protein
MSATISFGLFVDGLTKSLKSHGWRRSDSQLVSVDGKGCRSQRRTPSVTQSQSLSSPLAFVSRPCVPSQRSKSARTSGNSGAASIVA